MHGHCLIGTWPSTVHETWKWPTPLPLLTHKSSWWWQRSASYLVSRFPHLPSRSPPVPLRRHHHLHLDLQRDLPLNRGGPLGHHRWLHNQFPPFFLCSPLPSGTWRTPGLSIPWCCFPTSSSVCLVFFHLSPQWGAADAEIKVPSGENTDLKRSPFQAWSRSVYSHTCYAYCQGFLPCLFLPFQSIHLHFFQNLPQFFPVLACRIK